jgi:hypothetical protein
MRGARHEPARRAGGHGVSEELRLSRPLVNDRRLGLRISEELLSRAEAARGEEPMGAWVKSLIEAECQRHERLRRRSVKLTAQLTP